jgi:hypothetical protein
VSSRRVALSTTACGKRVVRELYTYEKATARESTMMAGMGRGEGLYAQDVARHAPIAAIRLGQRFAAPSGPSRHTRLACMQYHGHGAAQHGNMPRRCCFFFCKCTNK